MRSLALIAGLLCPVLAWGQEPTRTRRIEVGGFVDVYYAYDFGKPRTLDRVLTTQAARHNEINVNLAHLAASLSEPRVRARLAVQFGTAVQVNSAGEPTIGSTSGPEISRHLQEARVGVRPAPNVWIDAGIYSSYIGAESWISRENPTYSRSLVAEFTPYYLSGLRLSWQASPRLAVQFHVMNGWQKVSEDNGAKALGARIDWSVHPGTEIGATVFAGNEQPSGRSAATRWLHQVIATHRQGRMQWQVEADFGHEAGAQWHGVAVISRVAIANAVWLSGRLETYHDPAGITVAPSGGQGLVATGFSIGLDLGIDGLLWRSELKALDAEAAVFPRDGLPNGSRHSLALISSFALGF